jgi:Fe-S-cluster formation regulator IscX/YfhJ
MEEDIKQTLSNILEFVDADPKYVEYAQLQTWLENLIKRNR